MTTHALPTRNRRSTAGPTADLVGLPDPGDVRPTVLQEVHAHLTQIERARQRQLEALPPTKLDAVAAAHRATVERILDEVRTARHRVEAGLYGTCSGCSDQISLQRLELRPWATMCPRCATRERS